MFFGFDDASFYLRLDLSKWDRVSLILTFSEPAGFLLRTPPLKREGRQSFFIKRPRRKQLVRDTLAAVDIIEWAVSLSDLGLAKSDPLSFRLQILQDGIEREIYPESDPVKLSVPSEEFTLENWFV